MRYLILLSAVLLGASKGMLQGKLTRTILNNTADICIYNSIVFLGIGTVALFQCSLTDFNAEILLYALVYALFNAFFQLANTIAIKNGPLSMSSLLCNFSVGFTVLFGILRYGDVPSKINIVGFGFLILSLLLSADIKNSFKEKMSTKWLIASLCAALFNAGGAITVTAFGKSFGTESNNALLAAGNITAFLIIILCYRLTDRRERHTVRLTCRNFLLMLAVSAVLSAYQPIMLRGVKLFPSSVYFPILSTSVICLVSAVGIVIFHDKLKSAQFCGLIFGLVSIVLLTV